jgi:hypothetical protein
MAAGLPAEVLGEDVIRADVIEMLAGIKYQTSPRLPGSPADLVTTTRGRAW